MLRALERLIALTRIVPPADDATRLLTTAGGAVRLGPFDRGSLLRLQTGAGAVHWRASGDGTGTALATGAGSVGLGPWSFVDIELTATMYLSIVLDDAAGNASGSVTVWPTTMLVEPSSRGTSA